MSDETQKQEHLNEPPTRMHWIKLVLDSERSLVIAAVLLLLGIGISWFSFNKISSLSSLPDRYSMYIELSTTGCNEQQFATSGYIGTHGISMLGFQFYEVNTEVLPDVECWIDEVKLESNLPLQPTQYRGEESLFEIDGFEAENFGLLNRSRRETNDSPGLLDRFNATVLNDQLVVKDETTATARGIEFENNTETQRFGPGQEITSYIYSVSFERKWQPRAVSFTFALAENVKTFFNIYASIDDQDPESETDELKQFEPLGITVRFRTDDVSVNRGQVSDTGEVLSVNGGVSFGIENSDAESHRESGNVTYSAILGIGIALLTEAFVILLAVAVLSFAAKRRRT